jgi:hypothetical protein
LIQFTKLLPMYNKLKLPTKDCQYTIRMANDILQKIANISTYPNNRKTCQLISDPYKIHIYHIFKHPNNQSTNSHLNIHYKISKAPSIKRSLNLVVPHLQFNNISLQFLLNELIKPINNLHSEIVDELNP